MKILFIIPSLKGGGQEKAGMLLCNHLMQRHEVTAVCFEPKHENDYDYKCQVERIIIKTSHNPIIKLTSGIRRIVALRRLKGKLNPDISIAFGNTAIILNAISSTQEPKIASIRAALTTYASQKSISGRVHFWLYGYALKQAFKIVPVSSVINAELKKYLGIDNELFINNGYDFNAIKKMAAEPVIDFPGSNSKVFVHCGRFDITKGQWHAAKIFCLIKAQVPNCKLIFIGGIDQSNATGMAIYNYCQQLFTSKGITYTHDATNDADVYFLGHVANPHQYLKRSDIFLLTSLTEGFPNAMVEGMVCGNAIAASDCLTGPRDILLDHGTAYGLLFPAFNFECDLTDELVSPLEMMWANELIEVLKNPERLQELKSLAQKRALAFDLQNTTQQWDALLQ